jgi:hypothetical protein
MLRDELRNLSDSYNQLSALHRLAYTLLLFCGLTLIGSAIFFAPIINSTIKLWLFIIVLVIVIFIAVSIYWSSRRHVSATHEDDYDRLESNIETGRIPPRPDRPPTSTAEKDHLESVDADGDAFEIPLESHVEALRDNPSLYRHRFSLIPVVFKIVLTVSGWICLLLVSIGMNTAFIWAIFGFTTILAPLYCYYIALRWNGEEFIVNDEWYERPLTMPVPFTSSTPAIRRSEIGKYFIKQTVLDKIFKTCRLYSDTPSPDDKQFHNVKWLTHPTELRRATGISAPRKNSYLSPFRRRS